MTAPERITAIAGGCADCNATQELVEVSPGVFLLTVLHDPTCPELARIEGRREQRS